MKTKLVDLLPESLRPAPRYRWWHAVGFGVAANSLFGLVLGRGQREDERRFYDERKQAPFAPPSWLFSPAWALNNVSLLWGDLDLANEPAATPDRETLLAMQALWWGLYATFGYVYFRKQSPILALAWTGASYALTIATTVIAARTGRDRLAKSQITTLAWLSLATPVAAYQARHNPDPVFGYDPAA